MNKNYTIEQMSNANTLLQKLVEGVQARWNGKGKMTAFEAYNLIDEIYAILHNDLKTPTTEQNATHKGF